MKQVNVGIIGFGTVGAGVAEALLKNADIIGKRTGVYPVLKRIADLDTTTDRGVKLPDGVLINDAKKLADEKDIDIVVELVGGTTFAKDIILRALENGKSVVTANKALIATYGQELFEKAKEKGVDIGFEASVGGGIPCIKALREGLVGNRIHKILGILNGTCNYILTKMETDKADFEEVLSAAQKAGYAEANPALDVDGFDTAHKAAILASLAYGKWFKADDVQIQGIRSVTITDIESAAELGYRIKLLASIKEENGKIQLGVHPALVPANSLLGSVNDVFNAVWVDADVVGKTMYYGRGAGRQATSSAVVADIVDIGLNLASGTLRRNPAFTCYEGYDGFMAQDEILSRFYIRMLVVEKPGVLAKVSGILGKLGISLASVTQKENSGEHVPMIMLTHLASVKAIEAASKEISALPELASEPVIFRIEDMG
ncbi:MAG: homoserine dehydrogenase [Victivallales bacterium]|nr:homoserine dehydrogenase [Victivallales bacterium]